MITRNQEIHHPKIRRFFKSTDELAELLGRSRNYTTQRMNGHKEFLKSEKLAIAATMQMEVSELFPEES